MWNCTVVASGTNPAQPGSVFDNFLLLYVHMLLVALAYMLAS